jgi:hypothetical protein
METKAEDQEKTHRYYIIEIAKRRVMMKVKREQIELFLELHGDLITGAGDTQHEAIIDASIKHSKRG